jgi:hypothetical protein
VPLPGSGREWSGWSVFADGHGNYFSVAIDAASEFEGDAVWNVRIGEDGASVRVDSEGRMCEAPADPSTYEGSCSAGNGSLEIGTHPPLEIRGRLFWFGFGNREREAGVDLEPFRSILRSFRAR